MLIYSLSLDFNLALTKHIFSSVMPDENEDQIQYLSLLYYIFCRSFTISTTTYQFPSLLDKVFSQNFTLNWCTLDHHQNILNILSQETHSWGCALAELLDKQSLKERKSSNYFSLENCEITNHDVTWKDSQALPHKFTSNRRQLFQC